MLILAPLIVSLVFLTIIYRWRFFHLPQIPNTWMLGAFVLKIIAGLALWFVYSHYYKDPTESDALRYLADAITIRDQWSENREVFWSFMLGRTSDSPQYLEIYDKLVGWTSGYRYGLTNDCSTIIRLNTLIAFVSGGNYHVHSICMSFLAFSGFTALYRALVLVFSNRNRHMFVACFLLPSVVFWSSGLLKEGPLFLALGFLFYSGVKLLTQGYKLQTLLILSLSLVLLIFTKEYVIIALSPAILFVLVTQFTRQRFLLITFFVVHILCFIVAQNAHHIFLGGDFLYVLHKKQIDFYNVALLREAGSTVYIPPVANTISYLANFPQAFFLTYLRPHIFEAKSWIYFLFALENLVYMIAILVTLLFFKKPTSRETRWLLFCMSFVLVLAAIIGNCVPILGSMVRYRIAAIPFLAVSCMICFSKEKWQRLFLRFNGQASNFESQRDEKKLPPAL